MWVSGLDKRFDKHRINQCRPLDSITRFALTNNTTQTRIELSNRPFYIASYYCTGTDPPQQSIPLTIKLPVNGLKTV